MEYEVHWLIQGTDKTICGIQVMNVATVFAFNEDLITCRYCKIGAMTYMECTETTVGE